MSGWDTATLAQEFLDARPKGAPVTPPSHRYAGWNLAAAYEVGNAIFNKRRETGWNPVGRKIGFTNKTIWPSLGMDTVIWAYTYEQTVRYAENNRAELSLANTHSCLIEPEIVFKLKAPITAADTGDVAILEKVEWLALGYEVVDCNFPDWKFIPMDAVADFGRLALATRDFAATRKSWRGNSALSGPLFLRMAKSPPRVRVATYWIARPWPSVGWPAPSTSREQHR